MGKLQIIRYLTVFIATITLSLALTPLVRKFALKYRFVASAKKDRFHRKLTALLGGVGIFVSTFIGILVFVPLDIHLKFFLTAASIVFLWGLVDDFRPLRPQMKLLGQIIAGCIVISSGVHFNITPYLVISYILTIIWIVGITNAFNLLDNMDGLAAGIAAISSLMIFVSTVIFQSNGVGTIVLIIAASCLGFLFFNFNPAKIYMGDSGSMFLGFSLACVSIMGSTRNVSNVIVTLVVPVLILAVPIFDTVFVMIVRNIKGRSFWIGGSDHTSHRLVSLGLSEKKAVLIMYSLSVLFGFIALLYTKIDLVVVSILALLTILIMLFFGIFLSEVKVYEKEEEFRKAALEKLRKGSTIINTVLLYKRNFFEVIIDFLLICSAYYSGYLLKYEGTIPQAILPVINQSLPVIIIIKLIAFSFFGLYSRVWQYMSISDGISVFKAVTLSSLVSITTLTFLFRFTDYSRVVFILDWLILLFFAVGIRVMLPLLNEYFFSKKAKERRILIYGAGNTGESILREIKRTSNHKMHPIGFIDDDMVKMGKKIRGIRVLGAKGDLKAILETNNIDELIVAIPSLDEFEFKNIFDLCQLNQVKVQKIDRIISF